MKNKTLGYKTLENLKIYCCDLNLFKFRYSALKINIFKEMDFSLLKKKILEKTFYLSSICSLRKTQIG